MRSTKTPKTERRNHILYLDHYGKFPFDALPRSYDAAVAKFSKAKLEANGVLPWQIGVYSQKLTEAMRAGNWEQARWSRRCWPATSPRPTTRSTPRKISTAIFPASPASICASASNLVDRYSLFFPMRPNDAAYHRRPHRPRLRSLPNAHSWLENILLADRRARDGLTDYTDDYYDRFYNQAGATLIRQLTDAATDVGSYWLTSWINAGRPALPRQ